MKTERDSIDLINDDLADMNESLQNMNHKIKTVYKKLDHQKDEINHFYHKVRNDISEVKKQKDFTDIQHIRRLLNEQSLEIKSLDFKVEYLRKIFRSFEDSYIALQNKGK